MERWAIPWCLLRYKRKYRLLVDQTQLWHLQSQSRTAWADLFKGPAFLAGAVLIETLLIHPGLAIVVWLWNRPPGFMCLNTRFQGGSTKSEGCRIKWGGLRVEECHWQWTTDVIVSLWFQPCPLDYGQSWYEQHPPHAPVTMPALQPWTETSETASRNQSFLPRAVAGEPFGPSYVKVTDTDSYCSRSSSQQRAVGAGPHGQQC